MAPRGTETVALARELGPGMSNPELAAALNAAGHRTGAGHAFDTKAACNLRHAHRIAPRPPSPTVN